VLASTPCGRSGGVVIFDLGPGECDVTIVLVLRYSSLSGSSC
jgi:hypothetical protein